MAGGSVPVSALNWRLRVVSAVRLASSAGMVPLSWFRFSVLRRSVSPADARRAGQRHAQLRERGEGARKCGRQGANQEVVVQRAARRRVSTDTDGEPLPGAHSRTGEPEVALQVTPAKVQKLVAVPAAALLQPELFFQPVPLVLAYRVPSAAQKAALLAGSQVKAARATATAPSSSRAACSRAGAITPPASKQKLLFSQF